MPDVFNGDRDTHGVILHVLKRVREGPVTFHQTKPSVIPVNGAHTKRRFRPCKAQGQVLHYDMTFSHFFPKKKKLGGSFGSADGMPVIRRIKQEADHMLQRKT